jgi:hypothetical protein
MARLRAAAVDLQRAQKDIDDARERRDRLIWQAVDEGASYRAIGDAARLYASGIVKVLARRHHWQED